MIEAGVIVTWIFMFISFPIQVAVYLYKKFFKNYNSFWTVGPYWWWQTTAIPAMKNGQLFVDTYGKYKF